MSISLRRTGESDADAVDAAVSGGKDFEAEAVFLYNFAAQGDVAGDLGDEAAEGGGLVVLGQAEGGGVIGVAYWVARGLAERDGLRIGIGVGGISRNGCGPGAVG